jgi:glucose uptake protein
MILPQTYWQCLALLIIGSLCLGSWAATYRVTRNWRFELYYLDYIVGAALAAAIYALTLGSLGFDGFAIGDDLLHAGKRQWLFAFVSGTTFNLANMFVVGAISLAGLTVAMMLGAGLGVILGIGVFQLTRTGTNIASMGISLFFALAAFLAIAVAYGRMPQESQPGQKTRGLPNRVKGLLVSLAGGLLMALTYPLFGRAVAGEIGLGPYTAVVIFTTGIVISSFLFSMFFMSLPLSGEPLGLIDYVRGGGKTHLMGLLGGMIWCTGFLATFITLTAPVDIQPHRFVAYTLVASPPLIGALWGVLVFREFRASARANLFAFSAILLTGISLLFALKSGS